MLRFTVLKKSSLPWNVPSCNYQKNNPKFVLINSQGVEMALDLLVILRPQCQPGTRVRHENFRELNKYNVAHKIELRLGDSMY